MNFVERIVSYINPVWALRREVARTKLDAISRMRSLQVRKYEGASTSSRVSRWLASDSSANTEVRGGAKLLRERARDLRRNNAYAQRIIQVIATNVVGDGIRPQFNHDSENKENRALKRAMEEWALWAESRACDLEGRHTIIQFQSMIMEAVVGDGELFVIRHRQEKATDENPIPLKIQVLEADYLDHSRNEKLSNGNYIVQGIECDPNGKVLAYHFFKSHPGDAAILNLNSRETMRFEADRVVHIMRADRPHQNRAVSWLAPVMIRLHDLDIFQDATLQKQKIAACFAAYLEDDGGDMVDSEDESEEVEILEKMDSGSISILPSGKKITFQTPPRADDYPEFMKQELRSIAVGVGITYEALTGDLTGVNFSSGRMGWIEMGRNIRRWQAEIICAQFMDPIFQWFIEALDLVTPGNMDMSKVWIQWTRPAREMIDPTKEIPAAIEAINSCQTTLSEVLRSRGYDPETIFQERAKELKRLKELGIELAPAKAEKPKPGAKPPKEGDENENEEETTTPEA